jgi:uncharacterized protein YerC
MTALKKAPKKAVKKVAKKAVKKTLFDKTQAKEIRTEYAKGSTYAQIANKRGVCVTTVQNIVMGRTYKDAGGPIQSTKDAADRRITRLRSLSDKQIAEGKKRVAKGETYTAVAIDFGVSVPTIRKHCGC